MAGTANPALTARITLDTSNYDRGIDGAKKKADSFEKKWKAVANKIGSVGQKMSLAITAPLTIAGGLAVDAASDLEESMSKVNVVFGASAEEITNWSETSATAFGLTQQAALEAAGTYGNLFQSLGVIPDASAEMSMGLVQLSADLASFNNANPEEVLQSLQSGLVGSIEPLRKFGIELSQSAVQEKAVEMGLIAVGDEMTEAQKLTARYAVIMEQSSLAQGDFARTSEGLANQQRILQASLGDLMATLGTTLLPIVSQVVTWITQLVNWFNQLDPAIQQIVVVVLAVVAAIGPLLMIVSGLISAFTTISAALGAVGLSLSGIIAPVLLVIGALALLWAAWQTNFGGIRDLVAGFWAMIQPILMELWNWLQNTISNALVFLADVWQNILLPAIEVVISLFETYVMPILQLFAQLIVNNLIVSIKFFVAILTWLWTVVKNVWTLIRDNIVKAIKLINEWMIDKFGIGIAGFVTGLKDGLVAALNWTIGKVEDFVNGAVDAYNKLSELTGGFLPPVNRVSFPPIEIGALSFQMPTNTTGGLDALGDMGTLTDVPAPVQDALGDDYVMTPYGPVHKDQIDASLLGDSSYRAGTGFGTGPGTRGYGGGGGASRPGDLDDNGVVDFSSFPVDRPWFDAMIGVVEEIRDLMLLGGGGVVTAEGDPSGLLEAFREVGDQ